MSPLVCSGDVSGVNESLKRVQNKVMMVTTAKTSVEMRAQMAVNQLRSASSSSALFGKGGVSTVTARARACG